jgi:GTP cyclohydrolase I
MSKPSKEDALKAICTILSYIGADTTSTHLQNTAQRVVASYAEIYGGYTQDIAKILLPEKFYDKAQFNQPVLLKQIEFSSMCAHHMLPIIGQVHISYLPKNKIVGISKLARIVDVFAARLQVQENMTAEIAITLQQHLDPLGVAVKICATHHCMMLRGVKKQQALMETCYFTGTFAQDQQLQRQFLEKC